MPCSGLTGQVAESHTQRIFDHVSQYLKSDENEVWLVLCTAPTPFHIFWIQLNWVYL